MRERRNVRGRQSLINVTYELVLTCKVSRCLHELGIGENICIMVMRAFKENAQPCFSARDVYAHITDRKHDEDLMIRIRLGVGDGMHL